MINGHPEPPEPEICERCGDTNDVTHCAICHREVCYSCLDDNTCLDCVADQAAESDAEEALRAAAADAAAAEIAAGEAEYQAKCDADARAAYEAGGGDGWGEP